MYNRYNTWSVTVIYSWKFTWNIVSVFSFQRYLQILSCFVQVVIGLLDRRSLLSDNNLYRYVCRLSFCRSQQCLLFCISSLLFPCSYWTYITFNPLPKKEKLLISIHTHTHTPIFYVCSRIISKRVDRIVWTRNLLFLFERHCFIYWLSHIIFIQIW